MTDEFVSLAATHTIRGSEREQQLIDLRLGRKYVISKDQFDFLSLCDGTRTLSAIMAMYDKESEHYVTELFRELTELGAVTSSPTSIPRQLPKTLVPDIRLQAVHLEATSSCNMRCAHCYQGDRYKDSPDLTWEELCCLAVQMKDLQVENVSFSGGEPLINGLTFPTARMFEENDMRVSAFFTNGWQLSEGVIADLLSLKSKATAFVSLDAITAEGMAFRGFLPTEGQIVLDHVVRNIKALVDGGVPVVVNTVMANHNVDHLATMYALMSNLGVRSWRIGFPKQTGFFAENHERFGLEWQTMAEKSFAILKNHFSHGLPFHLQIEYLYRPELFENLEPLTPNDFVCDYEGRREGCCIKPNGDVVSCAYCTDFPMGSIRTASLESIWYSPGFQAIKNVRIQDVAECRGCRLIPLCATGCRVNAYFLHGDFANAKDDYACMAVAFFEKNVLPFLEQQGVV